MIYNKKAAVSLLGKIIVVLIIVALLAFIVPKMLHGGVSTIEVEQCKKTFDYDSDGMKWDDPCPCDYGGFEGSKYFILKGNPSCIMERFEKDSSTLYKFSDISVVDRKSCEKSYTQVVSSLKKDNICGENADKALKDGFSKECGDEILQKDPNTGDFAKKCATPDWECNEKLVKECRKSAGNIKI